MRRAVIAVVMLWAFPGTAFPQQIEQLKASVVKIVARNQTGTGFVVAVDGDSIYLVTASHVVEGDRSPQVEFFHARSRPVRARIGKTEGSDPKGLAYLVVSADAVDSEGLAPLSLAADADLKGGEDVITIGFGRGQGDWAVIRATVASMEGRYIRLDGRIREGNSGGPVIQDGWVIGLVTEDGEGSGVATPAESVAQALRGWGVPVARGKRDGSGSSKVGAAGGTGDDGSGGRSNPPTPLLNGTYAGQSFGQDAMGRQYVCNAVLILSQSGASVSGGFQNSCGDRGNVSGEVLGNVLRGRIDSVLSGVCEMSAEIRQLGQGLAGQFRCLTLGGGFTLVRR